MPVPTSLIAERQGFALIAGALSFAVTLLPLSATAGQADTKRKLSGTYLLSDTGLDLAGGAVLYSDCTHEGSLIGALPVRGDPHVRSVMKFIPTTWVNNPDPSQPPYSNWAVPAELLDMPRLFLCYDVEWLSGVDLNLTEFCDWVPRDLKTPLEIDFNADGIRDLLVAVDYHDKRHGAGRRCADQ